VADAKTKFKSFFRTLPFVNMWVPEIKNESKGIYLFGKDNLLPNKLLKWVLDSGTAKRAAAKRAAYIAADGFLDETAANLQVNPFQTADKILTEIALYCAYFKGFTLHVKRKEKIEIYVKPIQCIRKKLDGNFVYNPSLSTLKVDQKQEIVIKNFLGIRPITQDELNSIQANGELIYAYHRSADNPQYPIPDYYAGIEDIRTGAELQRFDLESVTNAFLPSAILTIIGGIDDETEDEEGLTEKDRLDDCLDEFTGNVKDSEGRSRRMSLAVLTARTKDEVPVLQTFDAKAIIEASNTKRDLIDRAQSRLFGVHPMLLGFADPAGLGNQQAMANASNELNNDVLSDQQLITEIFAMVYPNINWDISTFRPIQFIPDRILDDLTSDERRALVGFAPLKKEEVAV
jgi:hypothetical protein